MMVPIINNNKDVINKKVIIIKQDIIFCISVDIYLFLQRDSIFLS